jgi:hypothetical protein
MLDGVRTGMTSVTFYARLPESVHKGHQYFLPHNYDTLSVVQHPLLSMEQLLQLSDHCMRRRQGPMPISKQKSTSQ